MHCKLQYRGGAKRPDQLCSSPLPNTQRSPHTRGLKLSDSVAALYVHKNENGVPTVESSDKKIWKNLGEGLKRVGLTAREIQVLGTLPWVKAISKLPSISSSASRQSTASQQHILKRDKETGPDAVARVLVSIGENCGTKRLLPSNRVTTEAASDLQ